MNIKHLKEKIESGGRVGGLLVFKDSSDYNIHFLCLQYIRGIIKNFEGNVTLVDSLSELVDLKSSSLFIDDSMVVCTVDLLDRELSNIDNSIILCKKIDVKFEKSYDVVEFKSPDDWCIEDYILSRCSTLGENTAKQLRTHCKNNLFLIENELDKICLFENDAKINVFEALRSESYIDDTTSDSMFDLANSIISRNFDNLRDLWSKVNMFDSDPMWLISILISQYKTIIDVFLHPNSSPEYCGISQKRFNAIKFYNKNYNRKQLINIFMFLNGIDSKLKSGDLSDINLLDYIIINVIQLGGKIT